MRIVIQPDPGSVAARAADLVESLLRRKPGAVIGLAAGATPLALYAELARRDLDFSGVTAFGLDEYLGLGADHPASCANTLARHLVDKVNLAPSRVHLLDGCHPGDLAAYAQAHEDAIRAAGGLDLQILGIGVNGHIGFNEPGGGLGGPTRAIALRTSTRATNRPIFAPAETPPTAITMGVGTILGARRVMLLATGNAKAEAIAKAAEGPVTAMVPASALQLHPDAVLLLDHSAAAKLSLKDDYLAEDALLRDLVP